MAAAALRAAFPGAGAAQIDEALRKSRGDAERAAELLLASTPTPARGAGGAVPSRAPPDLRRDPQGWFRHFDRNGDGLSQGEVADAVAQTIEGSDRLAVRGLLADLWPLFDTDSSGTISMHEFTKRDGLRDTLLAQTALEHHCAWAVAHPVAGGFGSNSFQELSNRFPQAAPAQVQEALARCNGNAAVAADILGRQLAAALRPSAPPASAVAPVSAAPVVGASPRLTGRRKALLIGINYYGTPAQLRGCVNDVRNIQQLLMETYGWHQGSMRVLTDDNPHALPTRANIEHALRWLTEGAQPGDVLFLHFSGHGAQQEDPHGLEEDGMNETILPVDFKRAGMITDDQLGDLVVKCLPAGVRLTAVMDCCHSGTGLDLPFAWTGRGWREETNPFHSLGDVQLFSGCADDDTSSDASTAYGAAGGAMTTALCDVLRANPCPTYPQLMAELNKLMRRRGFSQYAQLTSSQYFDFDRPFLFDDIIMNRNPAVGRTIRRRFSPKPRKMSGPLADMLGIGVAVAGGFLAGEVVGGLLGAIVD